MEFRRVLCRSFRSSCPVQQPFIDGRCGPHDMCLREFGHHEFTPTRAQATTQCGIADQCLDRVGDRGCIAWWDDERILSTAADLAAAGKSGRDDGAAGCGRFEQHLWQTFAVVRGQAHARPLRDNLPQFLASSPTVAHPTTATTILLRRYKVPPVV